MVKALLLSAAYGWFAGLLTVMVIVTGLFALILFIALKPIKKDQLDDSSSARKALGRRETELTIELLNKQNDPKSRAVLEGKLREVKSAERLVDELMTEDEAAVTKPDGEKANKPAPKANPAQAKPVQPAKPAEEKKAAPAANPAQAKPAPQAKPAEEKKAEQPAKAASDKPEADKK